MLISLKTLIKKKPDNIKAILTLKQFKELYKNIKKKLKLIKQRISKYYN